MIGEWKITNIDDDYYCVNGGAYDDGKQTGIFQNNF